MSYTITLGKKNEIRHDPIQGKINMNMTLCGHHSTVLKGKKTSYHCLLATPVPREIYFKILLVGTNRWKRKWRIFFFNLWPKMARNKA